MRKADALVLATLAALAGCLNDAPAEGAALSANDSAPLPPADAPRGADGAPLHVARVEGALPVDVTRWANGTFTVEQHQRVGPLPGIQVGEPAGVMRIDISDLVPRGVPSRVIAQVDAAISTGDVDLWLEVPAGEWRSGNWDSPHGGYTRFETGMVHTSSDPVTVVLSYDEAEPAPEFSYTLFVQVISDPELLVNGIVAGVTLPADARFDVEAIGEKRTQGPEVDAFALHVYAPDDAYLGAFPLGAGITSIALPEGSPAGEYAMLVSQGGRNARLLHAGGPVAMRPLGLEWANGDMAQLDANGRGAWTTAFDRAPLLAGVFFTTPNVAQNVDVSMTGPEGPVLSGRAEGQFVSLAPDTTGIASNFGWDSLWGAAGLTAGTYEATVAFETAAGAEPAMGRMFAAYHTR